ncbi:MAG: hypothetical protein JOZ04_04350, partial [Acidimicrobiia bacterium]|nr:hypothetical protein [Acidimicrobiia bacterium]
MAPKQPPPPQSADPEVSFSWPGQQRRRPDPGVLETRIAARRVRDQPPAEPAVEPEPKAASSGANLPARRERLAASGASERWIVTELRRQAVTSEAALRDMSERIDQLSRSLRQVVDFLPRLQQRPAGRGSGGGDHADAVLSQRIAELEARLEARFDELAGAASSLRTAGARGAPVDTGAVKTQVHEAMGEVTRQLADMGDRLRA